MSRALLTGGTGFVGGHLARRLVADGWKVHFVVRETSNLSKLEDIRADIRVYTHDGTTENMLAIMEAVSPVIVFHLASLSLYEHTPQDIVPLLQSNVLFATQLAETMAVGGARYLVNTSTYWQHYENKDYSPVSLYAATKQAFEDILQYYVETNSLRVITLKLFDTYGPDDPRPKLFNLLKKAAEAQQPLAMSPGDQLIDLVHVDDVVDAYIIAAERLLQGTVVDHERYAVSSNERIRLKDLVQAYEQVTNTHVPIEWGGREYRKREVMVPWDKGNVLPKWQPRILLTEGIGQLNVNAK